MKKLTLFLASLILLFISCDNNAEPEPEPPHKHTFATEWTSNEDYHWHAATCEHKDQMSNKKEHDWDSGTVTKEPTTQATGIKTFVCSICEAKKDQTIPKLQESNNDDDGGDEDDSVKNDGVEDDSGEENGGEDSGSEEDNKFKAADTSKQMALNMMMGWNLGNYLDSTGDYYDKKEEKYVCPVDGGVSLETNWRGSGAPKVTEKMIKTVFDAGFKSIRIPVSWHNHITDESNYTVDSKWMTRVGEVVDYAYNNGMCVIINVHHDNLKEEYLDDNRGYAITEDEALQKKSKDYLEKVWTQIATKFKDYDNKLVFEVLNEPRCVGTAWEWGVSEATGMKSSVANNIITDYEQTCIDAIRKTGGNNETRYIVVPAYAGSNSAISTYNLPKDSATDRLIFSFHAYSPYYLAMYSDYKADTTFDAEDEKSLDSMYKEVRDKFGDEMGIIIGEASCENKDNLDERKKWFTYYFKTAYKTYGMPTFLWDNGVATPDGSDGECNGEHHGYLNVKDIENNPWFFPELIEAAKDAVYSEE